MSTQVAGLIISQVRKFIIQEYPQEPSISGVVDRPAGYVRDYVEDSARSTAFTADAPFRY